MDNIREERDYGDEDGGAVPEYVEQDAVESAYSSHEQAEKHDGLRRRTLDHPLHFLFTSLQCTVDPALFPCKEFDEFDLRRNEQQ